MHADVIFDPLPSGRRSPPRAADELQDAGTADFVLQRALDRLDLSAKCAARG
jgi:hypothetical protein